MKYQVSYVVKFNKLGQISRQLPQTAADVVDTTCHMLVEVADTPVGKTGNLQNNVAIEANGLKGRVHWRAPYAGFVNNGTSRMTARPFIDQAVAQVAPIFAKAMQAALTGG